MLTNIISLYSTLKIMTRPFMPASFRKKNYILLS